MVYTEIKEKNSKKYYYRVKSIRQGKKVKKQREYLGVGLTKKQLEEKERIADEILLPKNKKIEIIKKKILSVLEKNKIKKAGIFGSYVRGEQKKNSDIDILIEPSENTSLFDFVGIKMELENRLGKKVDLVSYKAIHSALRKNILLEEVKIK